MARSRERDVFLRMLLIVGLFDLSVSAVGTTVYVGMLGIVEARVLVPLLGLRAGVAAVWLHRAVVPIRAWQLHERGDEHALLAADRAFSELFRRFGRPYVGGWVVAVLVAILLAYVGIPAPLPMGKMELLCGVVTMLAMAAAVSACLRPLLDSTLPALRAELGAALLERRLHDRRTPEAIRDRIRQVNLGLFSGTILALTAVIVLEHTKGARAEQRAKLHDRVSFVAVQLREGSEAALEREAEVELVTEEQLPELLDTRSRRDDETRSIIDERAELALAAAPLGDGRWVLVQGPLEENVALTGLFIFGFLAMTLVPASMANVALSRTLTIPLAELDDATRRVVEEGELTALGRVMPLRNDEIGALALNFNRMLDVLENLADAATTVAEGDLRVDLQGRGDLQDAFRGMLERLHEMVVQVHSASREVSRAAGAIQLSARNQEQTVDQQSERVTVVREAVATLARSADEIHQTADEVLDNAEQTHAMTNSMADDITELSAQTNLIGELLELIRDVADRSDLLALNGSLEATRAGEAGRGFGLVASEMRRLAERVTGTVGVVRERVADISATGTRTILATGSSRKLADATATAARRISGVTRRQSEETEQVSSRVSEVAELMAATVESTTQTYRAAEELRLQVATLEQLTSRFKLRGVDSPPNKR